MGNYKEGCIWIQSFNNLLVLVVYLLQGMIEVVVGIVVGIELLVLYDLLPLPEDKQQREEGLAYCLEVVVGRAAL
jgi:hypothetical protein